MGRGEAPFRYWVCATVVNPQATPKVKGASRRAAAGVQTRDTLATEVPWGYLYHTRPRASESSQVRRSVRGMCLTRLI